MAHPLACQLAPLMDRELEELHTIVARWVVGADSDAERARYRYFGSGLRELKHRIAARNSPPTQEEIEIALTVLLLLAGRRAGAAPH
jgi:hypothetical protein